MTVPGKKGEMLAAAQATVDKIASNFRRGLITDDERYRAVVETRNETDINPILPAVQPVRVASRRDDHKWYPREYYGKGRTKDSNTTHGKHVAGPQTSCHWQKQSVLWNMKKRINKSSLTS